MIMWRKGRLLTGFTIIEFLIYITILAIAVTALGLVSSTVFRERARNDVIQEVSQNGRFAMEKIGLAINESSSAIIDGNELELFSAENETTTTFAVLGGKLIMKVGEEEYDITTSKVVVSNLTFKKVQDSVKVGMIVSYNNQQGLPDYDFKSFFTSSFDLKD